MDSKRWLGAAAIAVLGLGATFVPGVTDAVNGFENEAGPSGNEAVFILPEVAPCNTCLVFKRGTDSNALGNPIHRLQLYKDGSLFREFQAVSGRADSQNRDRHRSGTEAPLPDGQYRVAAGAIPGSHPEVGGRFLPVTPNFSTGRTYLGLHWDPSYESSNGEDGTSGCIALTNAKDFAFLLDWVEREQPQNLIVRIAADR